MMTETEFTNATATIDVGDLTSALRLIRPVCNANVCIPLLTVALAKFGDVPRLIATNFDQELTVFMRATCTGEFQVAIDPPTAITALGNSTGAATVNLDDGAAHITTGQIAMRGPSGIDLNDFPTMNTGTHVHRFTIAEGKLHAALQAVRFAISTDETRYYLHGVFLTAVDGEMAMVATDGHRLVRHLMGVPYDGPKVIIPAGTVRTLMRLLYRDGNAPISITIGIVDEGKGRAHNGPHAITAECDKWCLKSRCIYGTYPKWEAVIGRALGSIGGAPSIRATVTQAHVSRLPKGDGWRETILSPGFGIMRIRNDHNEYAVEMPLRGTGAPFCLDAHYLRQLVGAVGDVEFTGSASDAPFIATPKNPKTVVVQMPMGMPAWGRGTE